MNAWHTAPAGRDASIQRLVGPRDSTRLILDVQLTVRRVEFPHFAVCFGYDSSDPLAVVLDFPGAATAASWRFSRDLLWEGLHKPTGQGAVRVWPPCLCHDRPSLRIMLRGAEDTALLDVPAEPLRHWLCEHSFALVSRGAEAGHLDWDIALAHLMDGR